jgi:Fe-S cluster assembly protein SufD
MIDLIEEKNAYLSNYALFKERMNGKHTWLNSIRKDAISRFAEFGFPTTRNEEWRFTNISPIAKILFRPAVPVPDVLTISEIANYTVCEAKCTQLVFLNGFYSEKLSTVRFLPKNIRITSLAKALDTDRCLVESFFARPAPDEHDTFAALNTAFLQDGAFVYLPPDTALRDPIHLLFLSNSQPDPTLSVPRSVIMAAAGSQASIVESYASLDKGVYFTNSFTEIHAGAGSTIDHYKLQRESENAFHVATLQVLQEQDSSYSSHSLSLGGSIVRNNLNVTLNGTGADCTLNGLYVTKGRQHVDNHTSIDHTGPNCSSRELYKGILDDTSSAVFNGRILVRKGAQKTNSRQNNRNLLLSKGAVINTMPQLEILANDVKCNHGATIGQLNEDELFYLRSRGIDQPAARTLLTYAFASEVLSAVKLKPIQCLIDLVLLSQLSRQEVPGSGFRVHS